MAEVDKSLLAFLNGLSKRIIFTESGITDEFLKDEVLGGISDQGLPTKEFRFGIDLWYIHRNIVCTCSLDHYIC